MYGAEQNQLGLDRFANFIKFQYFNVPEQKPAHPFSWVDRQHFTSAEQCQLGFSLVVQNTNMLNWAEQSQPGRYIAQNTNVSFKLVMSPTFQLAEQNPARPLCELVHSPIISLDNAPTVCAVYFHSGERRLVQSHSGRAPCPWHP